MNHIQIHIQFVSNNSLATSKNLCRFFIVYTKVAILKQFFLSFANDSMKAINASNNDIPT